jgi:hypothetical protein
MIARKLRWTTPGRDSPDGSVLSIKLEATYAFGKVIARTTGD